jgi:hypothetical protein
MSANDAIPSGVLGSTVHVGGGEVLPSTSTPQCDEGNAQEEAADEGAMDDTVPSVAYPNDVAGSTAPITHSSACENTQTDSLISPLHVRILICHGRYTY